MSELKPWASYQINGDLITVQSGIEGLDSMARRVTMIQINLQEKAVHQALAEKGLCITPIQPTEKIIVCMAKEIEGCLDSELDNNMGYKLMTECEEFYRAMIKAAQEE